MTSHRASVTVPLDEYQRATNGLPTGGALLLAGAAFAVGVIVGGFTLAENDHDAPRSDVNVVTTVPARTP